MGLNRSEVFNKMTLRARVNWCSKWIKKDYASLGHWSPFSIHTRCRMGIYAVFAILLLLIGPSLALRDVRISVPSAVRKGDNANLICSYDMEGDTLYTVKYYKGRREFYRYTPKENPAIKIFPHTGIRIEENLSNGSSIVLLSLDTQLSGKYSCEVSADAPSFHTSVVHAEMEVVETPEERPSITGIQSGYRIGDIIKGNCSSAHSRPAANLTWTINDLPVPKSNTLGQRITKHANNSESSSLGIYYMVTHSTFDRGRVKLRCYARLYDLYTSYSDVIIQEVNPRVVSPAIKGPTANFIHGMGYDASSSNLQDQLDDEGNLLPREHDYYLQQQYNDVSSSPVSTSSIKRWAVTALLLFYKLAFLFDFS